MNPQQQPLQHQHHQQQQQQHQHHQQQMSDNGFSSRAKEEPKDDMFLESLLCWKNSFIFISRYYSTTKKDFRILFIFTNKKKLHSIDLLDLFSWKFGFFVVNLYNHRFGIVYIWQLLFSYSMQLFHYFFITFVSYVTNKIILEQFSYIICELNLIPYSTWSNMVARFLFFYW